MTARAAHAYPFLIALIPTLNYAANNPAQYGMRDLAFLVAITLAACAAVYAIASLVSQGRAAPGLPAFVTLLVVACFFDYRRVARMLTGDPVHPPHLLLVPVWVVLSALLVRWIHRRQTVLDGLGRFLSLMAALLVAWSLFQVGKGWVLGERMVAQSGLVRELARPIEGPAGVSGTRRDVYLIVLDEYANSDVLWERFDFDNRPFEDSLRSLGFYLPRIVRSNYLHTTLSLPSLMNSAHLVALEREVGAKVKHPRLPNYLLAHSRVAAYLQERGYEYVFFPSEWWHSTGADPSANVVFRAYGGFDLMRSMSAGELERTVRGITLLSYFDRTHHWEAEHVRRTLNGVAHLAGSGGAPRFVFAHIIKPHDPYVFDRECGVLPRQKEDEEAGPYLDQIQCLNRLVLATVHRILARSEVPPIIILQGDHGSKLLHATGYPTPEDVPPAAARERFGAFGAYYLPDGGEEAFGDTVTVVNVMGNVLRHYFGAHLPRAGDEQYISTAEFPYDFRRVDAHWLARDLPSGSKARSGG
ncbi:MAG TPA: hypothetical protein VH700_00440 [Gemmatimonadales bacterium]|jgi:hypothetical protein